MQDIIEIDESTVPVPLVDYRDVEILRQEHVVLKHVNFNIYSGEMVYLIGRVGSGKSSLIKSMYAEIPVDTGYARIFEYDLTTIRRRDIPMLRRRVGVIFQDFQLLTDRNVYENLRFVLDARIEEVLKQMGMVNKSYKMPHELSGGEQQRIVIARSLLNSPSLIIADEPTGNLDPDTGEQIVAYLHEIASQGVAVVMATHNMQMLRQFPGRVVRCLDKELICE